MSKLILRPSGQSFEIDSKTNFLDCLIDNQVYIRSSCGGEGTCSDCIIKVSSGDDNISSPTFKEIQMLGNVFHITSERLACQCKIEGGDVTIDTSSHSKINDEQKLRNKSNSFKKNTRVRKEEKVKEIKEERIANAEKRKAEAPPQGEKDGGFKRPQPFVTEDLPEKVDKPKD